MNRTVPAKSNTPGSWATAWALQHTVFTGILRVESLTLAGKGGRRGQRTRTNTFYVSGGNAAPRREIKSIHDLRTHVSPFVNGLCEHCGTLRRNSVLRRGWHDDLPGQERTAGWLWACPACYVKLGLHESDVSPFLGRRSALGVHTEQELPVTVINVAGPAPVETIVYCGIAPAERALLVQTVSA